MSNAQDTICTDNKPWTQSADLDTYFGDMIEPSNWPVPTSNLIEKDITGSGGCSRWRRFSSTYGTDTSQYEGTFMTGNDPATYTAADWNFREQQVLENDWKTRATTPSSPYPHTWEIEQPCFACPPFTWQDEAGQATCKFCAEGSYFSDAVRDLLNKVTLGTAEHTTCILNHPRGISENTPQGLRVARADCSDYGLGSNFPADAAKLAAVTAANACRACGVQEYNAGSDVPCQRWMQYYNPSGQPVWQLHESRHPFAQDENGDTKHWCTVKNGVRVAKLFHSDCTPCPVNAELDTSTDTCRPCLNGKVRVFQSPEGCVCPGLQKDIGGVCKHPCPDGYARMVSTTCVDLLGDVSGTAWLDMSNNDCNQYRKPGWCSLYGDESNPEGKAKDKCCTCGGGSQPDAVVEEECSICAAGEYSFDPLQTSYPSCYPCTSGYWSNPGHSPSRKLTQEDDPSACGGYSDDQRCFRCCAGSKKIERAVLFNPGALRLRHVWSHFAFKTKCPCAEQTTLHTDTSAANSGLCLHCPMGDIDLSTVWGGPSTSAADFEAANCFWRDWVAGDGEPDYSERFCDPYDANCEQYKGCEHFIGLLYQRGVSGGLARQNIADSVVLAPEVGTTLTERRQMYNVVQGTLESERARKTPYLDTWQAPTDLYAFDDTLHYDYPVHCYGLYVYQALEDYSLPDPFINDPVLFGESATDGDALLVRCSQTGEGGLTTSCTQDPNCAYVEIVAPGVDGSSNYKCFKFPKAWIEIECLSSVEADKRTMYRREVSRQFVDNFELPQHWTYYNPLIQKQRSWTCGFVEVFHEMNGEWGKVCMRKDGATRAVGRLLGKATCSGIRKTDGSTPTFFEQDDTEVHDNVLSVVGPDSTEERNGLFTSFADLNRGLLSGQLNGYLDPSSSTYHVQGSRRSGEAHHFAQWEGEKKPRRPDVQRPSVFQPVADEAREVEWKSSFAWTPSTSSRVNYKNAYCPVSKPLHFDSEGERTCRGWRGKSRKAPKAEWGQGIAALGPPLALPWSSCQPRHRRRTRWAGCLEGSCILRFPAGAS